MEKESTSTKILNMFQQVCLKSLLSFLGDPFKESSGALMRTSEKDGHLKAGHDKAFKPAKTV